jgi:hypothetical protein
MVRQVWLGLRDSYKNGGTVTTVGIGDRYQEGKTGGCLVRDSYRRPGRKFLIHISAVIFLILEYTYV